MFAVFGQLSHALRAACCSDEGRTVAHAASMMDMKISADDRRVCMLTSTEVVGGAGLEPATPAL